MTQRFTALTSHHEGMDSLRLPSKRQSAVAIVVQRKSAANEFDSAADRMTKAASFDSNRNESSSANTNPNSPTIVHPVSLRRHSPPSNPLILRSPSSAAQRRPSSKRCRQRATFSTGNLLRCCASETASDSLTAEQQKRLPFQSSNIDDSGVASGDGEIGGCHALVSTVNRANGSRSSFRVLHSRSNSQTMKTPDQNHSGLWPKNNETKAATRTTTTTAETEGAANLRPYSPILKSSADNSSESGSIYRNQSSSSQLISSIENNRLPSVRLRSRSSSRFSIAESTCQMSPTFSSFRLVRPLRRSISLTGHCGATTVIATKPNNAIEQDLSKSQRQSCELGKSLPSRKSIPKFQTTNEKVAQPMLIMVTSATQEKLTSLVDSAKSPSN